MKALRKILLAAILAPLLAAVLAWWALLGNICSSPQAANDSTQNTIPYNCHGSTVFITPLQNAQLRWSIPISFLLILAARAVQNGSRQPNNSFKRTAATVFGTIMRYAAAAA